MKTLDTQDEIKEGDYIMAPDQDGRLVVGKVITAPPKIMSSEYLKRLKKNPKAKPTSEDDLTDDPNHKHFEIETHRGHLVRVHAAQAFGTPIPNANDEVEEETEETEK